MLRTLLAKETVTHFEMTDCQLTANGGLSDIESSLIDYVPGTTHQPCTYLKHINFSNLHTDDGDLAAETYASVLSVYVHHEHFVRQLQPQSRRK